MQADEFFLELQVESLDRGGYVATSRDFPGLVAQGRTLAETLEIAQDVARKLVVSVKLRECEDHQPNNES